MVQSFGLVVRHGFAGDGKGRLQKAARPYSIEVSEVVAG
ncbi:hypothetical protein N185_09465 [Sinorhizobium sp. GW3]|nr:hypothetical protein N185_09465 [Sinorhizobium sp. GW3]